MEAPLLGWIVFVFGYLLPLGHVALSPRGGPWRPAPGSGCPFGPRAGWIVIVLLLGPIGWLLYLQARRRRNRAQRPSGS